MPEKLRNIKAVDTIKVLTKIGFRVTQRSGSHVTMRDEKGHRTTIPIHSKKPLKTGTLSAIIKQAGLSKEEFLNLL